MNQAMKRIGFPPEYFSLAAAAEAFSCFGKFAFHPFGSKGASPLIANTADGA